MSLYQKIVNRAEKISVIGLGYVGMPIAVAFSKTVDVIGFDVNEAKIELYQCGIDPTNEVGNEGISACQVYFTAEETMLRTAKFHIVAVPTPVNADHTPDLSLVKGASCILGRNLTAGSVVVYESTVYPGVTEDVCIPILEKESGLQCGVDFKVGYSPERINPGDKVHRLESIIKVVSGMDEEVLDIIAKVYGLVVEAGIYKAESIRVAEAAKVIENSQRDINIAFMNELSIIFDRMGIDTKSVLAAAKTKWNFLNFAPGLVGGHCIGVDPYYLTYKAAELGYHSRIILSGRRINDGMGEYIAEAAIKKMIQANIRIKGAKVAILGITFKENCPDCRNTKVIDMVRKLTEYGICVEVADPVADVRAVEAEHGIRLYRLEEIKDADAVIVAVAHDDFANLELEQLQAFYRVGPQKDGGSLHEVAATLSEDIVGPKRVLIDVKGIFDRNKFDKMQYLYWRL